MLPKGELEAFFLLLGGIDCSPLGTIKPASPVQSYVLTSFICLKCIRLQQLYGLTLVGILLFCLVWRGVRLSLRVPPTHTPPPDHLSPFVP